MDFLVFMLGTHRMAPRIGIKNHRHQHSYGKYLHVNITLKTADFSPFVKKSFLSTFPHFPIKFVL